LNSAGLIVAAGNPVSFDWTLLAQIISFLILVYILSKFAWKPLMGMMEQRRVFIEENLAHAEEERREADRIKAEYQEEMRTARQEAQGIIEQATRASEKRAQEIVEEARRDTEKMRAQALKDIEAEKDRAVAEVKGQIGELSIALAERLLRAQLEVSGQSALIDRFIQEVEERPC
jgi:F-type H+-transporting ATPase subunit b